MGGVYNAYTLLHFRSTIWCILSFRINTTIKDIIIMTHPFEEITLNKCINKNQARIWIRKTKYLALSPDLLLILQEKL